MADVPDRLPQGPLPDFNRTQALVGPKDRSPREPDIKDASGAAPGPETFVLARTMMQAGRRRDRSYPLVLQLEFFAPASARTIAQ